MATETPEQLNLDDLAWSNQTALCTRDENCTASPSGHEPDCPVEVALKAEFGF